jgi:hypothetical protein
VHSYAPRHEGVRGRGGTGPQTFNLGVSLRWVIDHLHTPTALHTEVVLPIHTGYFELKSYLEASRCKEETTVFPLLKLKPRFLSRPTCILVAIPTELSWLRRLLKDIHCTESP